MDTLTQDELNKRNDILFVNNEEEIPSEFIKFNISCAKIGNLDLDYGGKIAFILDNNNVRISYDNEIIAIFYASYIYNKGLWDLLTDNENYFRYRLWIEIINDYRSCKLAIHIYINKHYLDELYIKKCFPNLLKKIISSRNTYLSIKQPNYNLEFAKNIVITNNQISKYLKINLYEYQNNNIKWMKELENCIDLGLNKLYFHNTNSLERYYIESINKYIYYDHINSDQPSEYRLIDLDDSDITRLNITLKGGVLADEVGLGKTLSMISLILDNPSKEIKFKTINSTVKLNISKRNKKKKTIKGQIDSDLLNDECSETKTFTHDICDQEEQDENIIKCVCEDSNECHATLIICPNRLCCQWFDEINKYIKDNVDLNIILITTITQYNKITKKDLYNADIVILSFSFIINERYIIKKETELCLDKINWYRVIIDEGHELLVNQIFTKKKYREMQNEIYKFNGKYKWICTGTPLGNQHQSLDGILNYLSNDYDNYQHSGFIIDDKLPELFNKYFRYNTKDSINDNIFIPEIHEENIFLKQTNIERAIYNAAEGDTKRMIQLCTHILISEYDSDIFNDENMTLDKVQKVMVLHYTEKIEKINNKIASTIKHMDNITNKSINNYDEIHKNHKNMLKDLKIELRSNKLKKDLFDTLDQHILKISNEVCPISLCEMDEPMITTCGHHFDKKSINQVLNSSESKKCPMCRVELTNKDIFPINIEKEPEIEDLDNINKFGTKMSYLIKHINKLIDENTTNRIIVFSQWNKMLKMVSKVLNENEIKHVEIKGNIYVASSRIRQFKLNPDIRVILLSSESCASGSNLTEATHIILLDSINTTKDNANAIESQAIGRAVRLGQNKNVVVNRLIMQNTIEHDYFTRNMN